MKFSELDRDHRDALVALVFVVVTVATIFVFVVGIMVANRFLFGK